MAGKLASIQALRALAALAVTVAHTYSPVTSLAVRAGVDVDFPGMITGAAGVDLFFVISGFIMVYTSGALFGRIDGGVRFMWTRLTRIAPMYWLCTTAAVIFAIHESRGDITHSLYDWDSIIASYFFLPYARLDGVRQPILGVGWTLVFEMFFYVCFAAAIHLRREIAVLAIAVVFAMLVLFGSALPAPLAYFSNSLCLEFVFGMAIALVYLHGVRVPRSAAYGLVGIGLGLLVINGVTDSYLYSRALMWGGPAGLLVLGAIYSGAEMRSSVGRFVVEIGNASYVLYLIHWFTMTIPTMAIEKFGLEGLVLPFRYLYAAGMVAFSVAAAIVIHRVVELPMTSWIRGLGSAPRRQSAV